MLPGAGDPIGRAVGMVGGESVAIAAVAHEQDFERDSNVIEVFIGRLRRKLDPDDRIRPIETLRGRGYRFVLARSVS